jgi:hypothetical protein
MDRRMIDRCVDRMYGWIDAVDRCGGWIN